MKVSPLLRRRAAWLTACHNRDLLHSAGHNCCRHPYMAEFKCYPVSIWSHCPEGCVEQSHVAVSRYSQSGFAIWHGKSNIWHWVWVQAGGCSLYVVDMLTNLYVDGSSRIRWGSAFPSRTPVVDPDDSRAKLCLHVHRSPDHIPSTWSIPHCRVAVSLWKHKHEWAAKSCKFHSVYDGLLDFFRRLAGPER